MSPLTPLGQSKYAILIRRNPYWFEGLGVVFGF
jgi:hypothetical protein